MFRHILNTVKIDNQWYVNADDVATLSGSVSKLNEEKVLYIYKKEPFSILYKADEGEYLEEDGKYLVPFEEATVAAGINLFVNDDNKISGNIVKTPSEISSRLYEITNISDLKVYSIYISNSTIFGVSGVLSRAISPFFGNGTFVGAITNGNEIKYYADTFTSILETEDSLSEELSNYSTLDNIFCKANKYIKIYDTAVNNDEVAKYFSKYGIDEEVLDEIKKLTETNSYDCSDIINWIKSYSKVKSTMDLDGFIETFQFMSSALQMNEDLLLSIIYTYADSDDIYANEALDQIANTCFGSDRDKLFELYGLWALDATAKAVDTVVKDAAGLNLGFNLGLTALDYVLNITENCNYFIYFPLYSKVQLGALSYYYDVEDSDLYQKKNQILLYVKSARSCAEMLKSDSDLKSSTDYVIPLFDSLIDELVNISESECSPQYNNAEVTEWLDENYMNPVTNVKYLGEFPLLFGCTLDEIIEYFDEGYEGFMHRGAECICIHDFIVAKPCEGGVIEREVEFYPGEEYEIADGLTTHSTYEDVINYLNKNEKTIGTVTYDALDRLYSYGFNIDDYTFFFKYPGFEYDSSTDSFSDIQFNRNVMPYVIDVFENGSSYSCNTNFTGKWYSFTKYDDIPISMELDVSKISNDNIEFSLFVNRIFYAEKCKIKLNNNEGDFTITNDIFTISGTLKKYAGCLIFDITESDVVELPEDEYTFIYGESII